ncbi:MAG: hypothetical protein U0V73_13410 [Acidimicrobiia bacterium]
MNRPRLLWITAILSVAAVVVAEIADPDGPASVLILLGLGIVVSERIELRPSGRARIPTSHAVVLVLLRAGTVAQIAVTVVVAEGVATILRDEPGRAIDRIRVFVQRLASAAVAVAMYQAITHALSGRDARWVTLLALAMAALGQLAVDEISRSIRRHGLTLALRERGAELALITSGMLMAIGYRGIDGTGGMGLWGPLLFSVPLLAAWYSFEQLRNTRLTYDQTIRALAVVPELGGHVRDGHAERVTSLVLAIAEELDLTRYEIEQLEMAALLHHIGQVVLDDPEYLGRELQQHEIAEATAGLLHSTAYLSPAGDIVEAVRQPHRGGEATPRTALGAQTLKVASDFDDLACGDRRRMAGAVETLYSAPGYLYDPRVLAALETVLQRRGALLKARVS